jgi:hypothetical protein
LRGLLDRGRLRSNNVCVDAAYYSCRSEASPPQFRRLGKGTDQRRFIVGFDKAPAFAMWAGVMAAGHRFSIINFAISVAALS